MTTENTVLVNSLAEMVAQMLSTNPEFAAALYAALNTNGQQVEQVEQVEPVKKAKKGGKKAKKGSKKAKKNPEWYFEFSSEDTEVYVKQNIVQVTVARGHAREWHDQLRAAGFQWSRKNRNWWAWLDDTKRAEVSARNIENDKATAGMTAEQKREYWAARRAARKSA